MTLAEPERHSGLQPGAQMLHGLARNWWLFLLRGIVGIIFGVLAFMLPGVTLLTLIILYGAYALTAGVLAIAAAIMGPGGTAGAAGPRWWLALVGLSGVAAGIITFVWPGPTAVVLLLFVAAWAIVSGVFEIIGAIKLRKEIDNEWSLIASGVMSVLFGLIIAIRPGAGALGLIWAIGAFAIVIGVLHCVLAFRLRRHKSDPTPSAAPAV